MFRLFIFTLLVSQAALAEQYGWQPEEVTGPFYKCAYSNAEEAMALNLINHKVWAKVDLIPYDNKYYGLYVGDFKNVVDTGACTKSGELIAIEQDLHGQLILDTCKMEVTITIDDETDARTLGCELVK